VPVQETRRRGADGHDRTPPGSDHVLLLWRQQRGAGTSRNSHQGVCRRRRRLPWPPRRHDPPLAAAIDDAVECGPASTRADSGGDCLPGTSRPDTQPTTTPREETARQCRRHGDGLSTAATAPPLASTRCCCCGARCTKRSRAATAVGASVTATGDCQGHHAAAIHRWPLQLTTRRGGGLPALARTAAGTACRARPVLTLNRRPPRGKQPRARAGGMETGIPPPRPLRLQNVRVLLHPRPQRRRPPQVPRRSHPALTAPSDEIALWAGRQPHARRPGTDPSNVVRAYRCGSHGARRSVAFKAEAGQARRCSVRTRHDDRVAAPILVSAGENRRHPRPAVPLLLCDVPQPPLRRQRGPETIGRQAPRMMACRMKRRSAIEFAHDSSPVLLLRGGISSA